MFNKIKLFILVATIFCTTSVTAFAQEDFKEISVGNFFNADYYVVPPSSYLDLNQFKKNPSSFGVGDGYNYYVMLFERGGGRASFYLYTADKPFYLVDHGGELRLSKPAGTNWNYYVMGSSNFVRYSGGYDETGSLIFTNLERSSICSFNHNLELDGEVFFCMEMTLPMVVHQSLKQMIIIIVTSTKSLTVLGISLLALLIGFPLLRKVFRKFRVV